MATATPAQNRSARIITSSPFTLTDRLRIQQDYIRQGAYTKIGKLTCVVWEGQKDTRGLSQENDLGRGMMAGFGQFKRKLWSGCTLDWLNHTNAPILAVSRDRPPPGSPQKVAGCVGSVDFCNRVPAPL